MLVSDIRKEFKDLYLNSDICENGTIEIINASFIANEATIFGTLDEDYAERELRWYLSGSRNVNHIAPPIPAIWKSIADKFGTVNSNYGWCIFSGKNNHQFNSAIQHLINDESSRQAVMIYNRPTMHLDSIRNGRKDFMCTYATQLLIRKNKLHYIVKMRSNDAVFGYKNDYQWHKYVFDRALRTLRTNGYRNLGLGNLYWNAGSLHVYPRHFKLIEEDIRNDKSR